MFFSEDSSKKKKQLLAVKHIEITQVANGACFVRQKSLAKHGWNWGHGCQKKVPKKVHRLALVGELMPSPLWTAYPAMRSFPNDNAMFFIYSCVSMVGLAGDKSNGDLWSCHVAEEEAQAVRAWDNQSNKWEVICVPSQIADPWSDTRSREIWWQRWRITLASSPRPIIGAYSKCARWIRPVRCSMQCLTETSSLGMNSLKGVPRPPRYVSFIL